MIFYTPFQGGNTESCLPVNAVCPVIKIAVVVLRIFILSHTLYVELLLFEGKCSYLYSFRFIKH